MSLSSIPLFAISTEQKQTDSNNPESAKRAHVDEGSAATSSIEGKQLQTQEEDKSEPPRITLRELPMEVWWHVIDELVNDVDALIVCALVCRGWAERSKRLLGEPIMFYDRGDVRQIAKLGSQDLQEVKSCRRVVIMRHDALRTLGLFAVMFGGKMPLLRTLLVQGGWNRKTKWNVGEMHVDLFHYLASFASITRLSLSIVTFPSVQTFGRLVSALPNLTRLKCQAVKFETHGLREGTFVRRRPPRNLTILDLDYIDDMLILQDISNFLVATEMASTLRGIAIGCPIELSELDESGVPALVSAIGRSLHSPILHFGGVHCLSQEALLYLTSANLSISDISVLK